MLVTAKDKGSVKRFYKGNDIQKMIVGFLAVTGLIGLFSSNRILNNYAYSLIMATMGYGLATAVANHRTESTFDDLVRELEQYKEELDSTTRQKVWDVEKKLKETSEELQKSQITCDEFTKKMKVLEQNTLNALTQCRLECEKDLQTVKTDYEKQIQVLKIESDSQLTTLNDEHSAEIEALTNEFNQKLSEYQQVIDVLDQKLEEIPRQFEIAIAQGKSENESLRQQNNTLMHKLLEFSQPKTFDGGTRADYSGNKVLDILASAEIYCDAVRSDMKAGFDELWIKPRGVTGIKDIEKYGDVLIQRLNLLDKPEFSIDSGCIKIKLYVEPTTKGLSAKVKQTDLKELLQRVIVEGNHIRLNGQRDSGKSTFANNIKVLVKECLPGVEIRLINPLAHSPKSNWNIPSEWDSFDTSVDGLREANKLMKDRHDLCKLADEQEIEKPTLEPVLFIVDELDTIISQHGDVARDLLKAILKTGTHFKVFLFMIGQTPNCKELKLYKADFLNTVSIYLGANIPRGIEESCLVNSDVDYWKAQLKSRQQNNHKYLGFVSHIDGTLALCELPKPNEYNVRTAVLTGENLEETENLDEVKRRLEASLEVSGFNSTQLENPDNDIENRAKSLFSNGFTVSQIVTEIWGLKPSRKSDYKLRVKQIEKILGV